MNRNSQIIGAEDDDFASEDESVSVYPQGLSLLPFQTPLIARQQLLIKLSKILCPFYFCILVCNYYDKLNVVITVVAVAC